MAIESAALSGPRTRTGEVLPMPRRAPDPADWVRFVANIAVVPGSCHLWIGERFPSGYGRFTTCEYMPDKLAYRQVVTGAHRYTYAAHHGPLPDHDDARYPHCPPGCDKRQHKPQLRHRCNETLCVREDHLVIGDAVDNAADRSRAGRSASRRHGLHPYAADTRPRNQRAAELCDAVRAELDLGADGSRLIAVVERVRAAGDPHAGQLTLPLRHLYLVR